MSGRTTPFPAGLPGALGCRPVQRRRVQGAREQRDATAWCDLISYLLKSSDEGIDVREVAIWFLKFSVSHTKLNPAQAV